MYSAFLEMMPQAWLETLKQLLELEAKSDDALGTGAYSMQSMPVPEVKSAKSEIELHGVVVEVAKGGS